MSTTNGNEEARAKTREIADRIKNDKEFARQAQTDPVGALQSAGMPEAAIGDFLREEGVEADVAGYARCTITCACTPCCVSGSCWITA